MRRLPLDIPPLAQVDSIALEEIGARGVVGFRIVASDGSGPVSTQIPADAATCADCLREMLDRGIGGSHIHLLIARTVGRGSRSRGAFLMIGRRLRWRGLRCALRARGNMTIHGIADFMRSRMLAGSAGRG